MKPPYRILHVIRGLDMGRSSGGAGLHAVRVCLYFDRKVVQPRLFTVGASGTEAEEVWRKRLREAGVAVDFGFDENHVRSPNLVSELSRLWSVINTFKPHIIHSHSERHDLLNALARILHPHHPYAVRTVHLDTQWKSRPMAGALINDLLFPFVLRGEFAVAKAIRDRLQLTRFRKSDHVWLCYNGMDAATFADDDPARKPSLPAGVPESGPRIGVVGRLAEQKGHEFLIEALKYVCQQLPAQLLIVGSGPREDLLKEKCKSLGLEEQVIFLGVRDDVPQLLSHLELLVLPSLWEGFPTVLLEAMVKCVPVVATDIPGNRELVVPGATGRLVPPKDPDRLAQAIVEALTDVRNTRTMAERARNIAKKYTIENTAACYTSAYTQILEAEG